MAPLLLLLILAAVFFFWAGFLAPRHALQHHSRAGFVIMLALTGLTGYFAWREARTIGELAKLIDPVPEITDVTYVPTAHEVGAMAKFLAAVPGQGRFGSTQAERRDFADRAEHARGEYWLLKTALSPEAVMDFYRETAPRSGWMIEVDEPQSLLLSRDAERLVLFVTDDFPDSGAQILYGFSVESQ
jgi:hypothetical protein